MVIALLAVLWPGARIYRVGIPTYGKKPNLPDIAGGSSKFGEFGV